MKKAIVLAILIIGVVGATVLAQCGCNQPPAAGSSEPSCYTAFWTGEEIHFKLAVPAEYFFTSPTPPTPLLTGWRVERLDGTVVFQDLFPDVPKGCWYEMVWNQRDLSCNPVPPGYYRIVVSTDSAGVYSTIVKILPRPGCFPCGVYPRPCSSPCPVPCGKPYINILSQDTYTLWGISIFFHVNCGCGCP